MRPLAPSPGRTSWHSAVGAERSRALEAGARDAPGTEDRSSRRLRRMEPRDTGRRGKALRTVRLVAARHQRAGGDGPGGPGASRGARRDQRPGLRPRHDGETDREQDRRASRCSRRADPCDTGLHSGGAATAVDRTLSLLRTAMNLPDPRVPRSGWLRGDYRVRGWLVTRRLPVRGTPGPAHLPASGALLPGPP